MTARHGVALVGGGKMGEALLAGWVRQRGAESVVVCERNAGRGAELTDRYGVAVVDLAGAAARSRVLVVAVKPQDTGAVLGQLAPHVDPGHLVVSVAAGVSTATIEAALPAGVAVVRVMPNTPALVGEGMSVLSAGTHAGDAELDEAEELLAAVGQVRRVPEDQQDAVTALSGSGPAYFFYLVEAMVDGGVALGLTRELATDLSVQTALGAAVLLRESGDSPEGLRAAVSSPGGTTVAAIGELDTHGVRAAVQAAVQAARRRSAELGRAE